MFFFKDQQIGIGTLLGAIVSKKETKHSSSLFSLTDSTATISLLSNHKLTNTNLYKGDICLFTNVKVLIFNNAKAAQLTENSNVIRLYALMMPTSPVVNWDELGIDQNLVLGRLDFIFRWAQTQLIFTVDVIPPHTETKIKNIIQKPFIQTIPDPIIIKLQTLSELLPTLNTKPSPPTNTAFLFPAIIHLPNPPPPPKTITICEFHKTITTPDKNQIYQCQPTPTRHCKQHVSFAPVNVKLECLKANNFFVDGVLENGLIKLLFADIGVEDGMDFDNLFVVERVERFWGLLDGGKVEIIGVAKMVVDVNGFLAKLTVDITSLSCI